MRLLRTNNKKVLGFMTEDESYQRIGRFILGAHGLLF